MDLSEQCAVVTGASSGIGKATAKVLGNEGVRVGLAARREDQLADVADQIEADGGEAVVIKTDVRDREQVASMIATASEAFGRLDIMVNNAGVGHWEHEGIIDGSPDEWATEIEVNLLGTMYGTHFAATVMQEQGAGTIVNIGSGAGRLPFPEIPSYVASKYGVRGFTEAALRDLRTDGIRVTHILPGAVETPMQPEEDIESKQMLDSEDVANAILFTVSQPDHVSINDLIDRPLRLGMNSTHQLSRPNGC